MNWVKSLGFELKSSLLLKGNLFFLCIMLTGCATEPYIEKKYDEIKERKICRLKAFQTRGPVKINLEADYKGEVNFLVSIISYNYLTNMHINPKVLFKIYKDGAVQNLTFQGRSEIWIAKNQKSKDQGKEQGTAILIPHNYSPYNLIYSRVRIPRSDFNKIASANRIEIFVQTNHDPAVLILSPKDLASFRKFQKDCF